MAQPKPWKDEVVEVLNNLGGTASLQEIYEEISRRGIMDFEENPNWRAAVRRTIEERSSDSEVFNDGNKDLFYSVDGIGAGKWGLR